MSLHTVDAGRLYFRQDTGFHSPLSRILFCIFFVFIRPFEPIFNILFAYGDICDLTYARCNSERSAKYTHVS